MIITTNVETDIGIMVAGAVDEGICLLEFSDRRMLNIKTLKDILGQPYRREKAFIL
jgi:lambda repressor-like predicted transcriptional regulator